MATWTKVPETHIASILGGMVGNTAGTVTSAVNKSLDAIEVKIENLQREASSTEKEVQAIQSSDSSEEANLLIQQKVSTFNAKASRETASISATLSAASANLATILKVLSILKTTAKTLKIPLPPLEILIKVIKMLPLPQRFLIVSFTVLESDLLEMLEQMIKQVEEEVSGIDMIVDSLEAMLQPILDRIERIRAQIALLTVSCNLAEVSDTDRDILDEAGLLDKNSGDSLFDRIQAGLQGGGKTACYGSNLDLSKAEIANQLSLASEGDTIRVTPDISGSFIETWFCTSEDQPNLPLGFPNISGSWTKNPLESDLDKLWKVDLEVSGKGNIFGGLDKVPEKASRDDLDNLRAVDQDTHRVLGYGNFNEKPGILKVDDWSHLLEIALDRLRNLPLSQGLKDNLEGVWNVNVAKKSEASERSTAVTKFQWMSPLGEVFNIEILEDEHSPRVAVRRFARVTDQGGTVVLDGIKTFSTDIDVLLTETKLQLEQMTR